jgi:MFS family permease
MPKFLTNLLPLTADIIASLVLFLGRHSLASRGYSETTVGTLVLVYGLGYMLSSLLMTRLIRKHLVRLQMLGALAGMMVVSIALANVQGLTAILALYTIFPFALSMFFNALQIYLLGASTQESQPLAHTIGHFTFSWSVGFALGPILASFLVLQFDWSQVYYLAALLAFLIGLLLVIYKPKPVSLGQPEKPAASILAESERAPNFVVPGWIGLLAGLAIWNTAMIFWPVQAVQLDVPNNVKGIAEFLFAITQAFAALGLAYFSGWRTRPAWFLLYGGFGVAALILMSVFGGSWIFFGGFMLYGAYLASAFSLSVFHCMSDESQAVRRVALNETLIGLAFLLSYPLAAIFKPPAGEFGQSYLMLALLLAFSLVIQAFTARRITLTATQTSRSQL